MSDRRRHRAYRAITNGGMCVYCGQSASSLDHFVPKSMIRALADTIEPIKRISGLVLIPACRECNSIAGARIFRTVGMKRRYIQKRLKQKYRKFLQLPNWSENETAELGSALAKHVHAGINVRTWIESRIAWKNNQMSENARFAAIRFASNDLGLSTA